MKTGFSLWEKLHRKNPVFITVVLHYRDGFAVYVLQFFPLLGIPIRKLIKNTIFFFLISDNFQLTFLAMAEKSKLHQAGSFHPHFPILCTLQFICSVLLPDTKSCYSTSIGKCTNGQHSSNNLRWYTVLNFDGNFVLFLGSVQLRAASKIRNCFCYLLTFNFM